MSELVLPLWAAKEQEENSKELTQINLGAAVEQKLIKSETLAYFMGRSFSFLTSVGIKKEAIRFRQHRSKEMAHYANDCWDAEVETSYGWIEIAGHSDRSAFDLERHAKKTKVDLFAARPLKEHIKVKVTNLVLNK